MRIALALTVVVVAVIAAARPAQACQIRCGGAWPARDTIDVPRDTTIVIAGGIDHDDLVLRGPRGRVPTRATTFGGPGGLVTILTPIKPLAPGTDYEVGYWTRFRTGTHRLSRRDLAPRITSLTFEEHELGDDPRWDCGDPDRATIAIEPDPGVGAYQVTIQHGGHARRELVLAEDLGDLATGCGDLAVEAGTEYCVELRAITANGHAGPPATACTTAVFVPRPVAPEPPAAAAPTPVVESEAVPPLRAVEGSGLPRWPIGALAGFGLVAAIVLGRRLVRPRSAR